MRLGARERAATVHRFTCGRHGDFTASHHGPCPHRASCPECMAEPPWFNTDIDAGPYGWCGAAILRCAGDCT